MPMRAALEPHSNILIENINFQPKLIRKPSALQKSTYTHNSQFPHSTTSSKTATICIKFHTNYDDGVDY